MLIKIPSARADCHPRGLHQVGARLQARHHLHCRPEAPSHKVIIIFALLVVIIIIVVAFAISFIFFLQVAPVLLVLNLFLQAFLRRQERAVWKVRKHSGGHNGGSRRDDRDHYDWMMIMMTVMMIVVIVMMMIINLSWWW